jgi:hypothetical protein
MITIRRNPLTLSILTLAVTAVVAAGCSSDAPAVADDSAQVATAAPRELTIRSFDFQYEMPSDTLESGLTNIRLINDGPDFHHVQLFRLEDGHTLQDLMDVFAAHGPVPSWAVDVGGPNTPGMPGEETSAIVDLQPGMYALVCVIPGQDGVPHVMKGMIRELTVVPSAGPPATLPPADIIMTLDDYSFEVSAPITAGRRTIRVENTAAQPHEVLFVKLEDGRTPMDFLQFLERPEGAPPGKVMGGVTGIAHGGMNQLTLDFEPGDYALICFVPDASDGAPHFVHGMVEQIRVE